MIEHRVVIAPRTILLACRSDHRIELIVALCAPRFIEQYGRDNLLSGTSQHLQIGPQQVVVLLTPSRHVVETAHAVGLLPVVQMELLLLWTRQRATDHLHPQGQTSQCALRLTSDHLQLPFVTAGLAVVGHLYGTPHGAQLAFFRLLATTDDVRNKVGFQVIRMVATRIETVREHPSEEVGLSFPLTGGLSFSLQAERQWFAGGIGLHHRLQSQALAAPCYNTLACDESVCQCCHVVGGSNQAVILYP